MSSPKSPALAYPVHEMIARRWSPYHFSEQKEVAAADLRSIFEAARWAPSAFNEQPWRFLVATRTESVAYEKLLSCLVEANQSWARRAPVLAMGIVSESYARNGKPNATARHDLGLAAGNICLEAAARGVLVHQMAGILPDRARELYEIPANFTAFTALAMGYPEPGEGDLAARDSMERERRPQAEFVFGGRFGQAY